MKNLFTPFLDTNKNHRSSTISERDDESIVSAYSTNINHKKSHDSKEEN